MLQYWRFFTSFFYLGELTISYIFSFILICSSFVRLESSFFRGKAASYLYCLWILAMIQIVILSLCYPIPIKGLACLKWKVLFLSQSFYSAVLYVWCKKSPDVIIRFLFAFVIRVAFLPWYHVQTVIIVKQGVFASAVDV